MNIGFLQKPKQRLGKLNLRTQLYVIDEITGHIIEQGKGIVRNIMPNGIIIADLELPTRSLPVSSFRIGLVIEEEPLKKIQMTCSVKRIFYDSDGAISLFLIIDEIPEKHHAFLEEYISLGNKYYITKAKSSMIGEIVLDIVRNK